MVQSSGKRSDTPRTLFKIILMLGLALAGVAAIAAEPAPAQATDKSADTVADSAAGCARTTFDFGGRVIENGEATDTWTLTCWRQPAQQASAPSPSATAAAKPVDAQPVASQARHPIGQIQGPERF